MTSSSAPDMAFIISTVLRPGKSDQESHVKDYEYLQAFLVAYVTPTLLCNQTTVTGNICKS